MAMDQCALLDLLAQLKLTDVTDRIRVATETLYQELMGLPRVWLTSTKPGAVPLRADGRCRDVLAQALEVCVGIDIVHKFVDVIGRVGPHHRDPCAGDRQR